MLLLKPPLTIGRTVKHVIWPDFSIFNWFTLKKNSNDLFLKLKDKKAILPLKFWEPRDKGQDH